LEQLSVCARVCRWFDLLDVLFMATRYVAVDVRYVEEVLGGRVVFAVDGMGARVAAVELTPTPPLVLLADHLGGDAPILVYRVADLPAELAALEGRGWTREATFEIPHGPCWSFRAPGGQRLALYQLT